MDLIEKHLSQNVDLLLACIDDAVLIVDHKGNILKYNEAFSRLAQSDWQTLVGENLYEIVKSGRLKESAALKSLQAKKKIDMNLTYRTGQTATWTYIPVFDEKGNLVLTIGTGRDITRLVDMEKKLKQSEEVISEYSDKIQQLETRFGLGNIIYSSDKMYHIMQLALKVAVTDSPVMILGETGVGKEMVASFIHQSSSRNAKPFIAINCASIPEELLESELFGYEEGSFTGAKKTGKKGLLEEADGGTLFLDEIGELPLKMQSKLLRFLQEGKFKKLGSNQTVMVNVRVLSATNLETEALMNSKHFRQDLFYRISVVPIVIPPLRQRKEDIYPLIRHFTKLFNEKYKTDMQIPPGFMRRLLDYPWPGNIRELKNVMERVAILYASQEPDDEDFDFLLHVSQQESPIELQMVPALSAKHDSSRHQGPQSPSLKSARDRLEESLIRQAYEKTGSIVKVAKLLGINPSTIHRKLKKGSISLHRKQDG